MANRHGDFIWYELLTSDADAAQRFYGAVVGWRYADSGQTSVDYRIIHAKDEGVGGLMQITDDMRAGGARPIWLGYVLVDDVDAAVGKATAAGGAVQMPAMDMPNVGRIAMVADAQGAPFYLMRPIPPADAPDKESKAFALTEPMDGHCAWNELVTSDPDAAIGFYTGLCGWRQEGEMDMGPMGKYRFFHHGPAMIGAVMRKPAEMPVSMWGFYFRVADIDAAHDAIVAGGGQVILGPQEIPGGEFSINGIDPQGAAFGLVGKRR
ncbi:MAG: VOC family protein [Lautropia sp.]